MTKMVYIVENEGDDFLTEVDLTALTDTPHRLRLLRDEAGSAGDLEMVSMINQLLEE